MSTEHDEVTYWEGWHRHAKEAIGPLDVDQARGLEQTGEPYLVLLGSPQSPRCFIEVNGDFFGVSFLDESKREHLMYTFEELEPQRLFLSEAVYRKFDQASGSVARGTVYRFSPSGHASVERTEQPFNRATISECEVDVSKNWELRPAFGDYASITREER